MSNESKPLSGDNASQVKRRKIAAVADNTIYLGKSQLPASEAHVYAAGVCFDKMVWLFGVASFVGFIGEIIFGTVYYGFYQTKQGMIYGPFNQLYGFGAIAMVLILAPLAKKGLGYVFTVGALVGGGFEYLSSLAQEYIIGTKPWDFSNQWLNFDGRTSVRFMILWGVAACFLMYVLYPFLSRQIQKIPLVLGKITTWIILIFFVANMTISLLAVYRWEERSQAIPPQNVAQEFLDRHYPDERLLEVFPGMQSTRK